MNSRIPMEMQEELISGAGDEAEIKEDTRYGGSLGPKIDLRFIEMFCFLVFIF